MNLQEILFLYLGLSVITFITFAFDKKAAKEGKWRTKESTLHILSLCGGWIGALLAQRVLRHKSKKQPFKLILWLMIITNIFLLVLLQTEVGDRILEELI